MPALESLVWHWQFVQFVHFRSRSLVRSPCAARAQRIFVHFRSFPFKRGEAPPIWVKPLRFGTKPFSISRRYSDPQQRAIDSGERRPTLLFWPASACWWGVVSWLEVLSLVLTEKEASWDRTARHRPNHHVLPCPSAPQTGSSDARVPSNHDTAQKLRIASRAFDRRHDNACHTPPQRVALLPPPCMRTVAAS